MKKIKSIHNPKTDEIFNVLGSNMENETLYHILKYLIEIDIFNEDDELYVEYIED